MLVLRSQIAHCVYTLTRAIIFQLNASANQHDTYIGQDSVHWVAARIEEVVVNYCSRDKITDTSLLQAVQKITRYNYTAVVIIPQPHLPSRPHWEGDIRIWKTSSLAHPPQNN